MESLCVQSLGRSCRWVQWWLLGALLYGCAEVPVQQMSNARQALQAAEQVDAQRFAPGRFRQAQGHLKRAEEALEVPAYREAHKEAELARARAIEARVSAEVLYQARTAVQEAARLGNLPPDTELLLRHAVEAAQQGSEAKAHALAHQVTEQANAAINQAHLKQAWALLNQLQPIKGKLTPTQISLFRSAEQAFWQDDGRKALELLQKLNAELGPQRQ
jgi:hypothetical protein